jgi:Phage tail lysozyme
MTVPLIAQSSILHYINDKGLTKDIAVGIVSCLYYESKLNSGSQGVQSTETPGTLNPSGAYGIASWNGPRQAALKSFADNKGLNVSDLNTQLDFVLTESANSYPTVWAAIQGSSSYENFIPIFVAHYENPADHQKEIDAAMSYANAWYPLITTSPIVVAPPPATVTLPPVAPLPATIPAQPTVAVTDPELIAIQQMVTIMEELPATAIIRVIAYLNARF